jgi:hypothetical protein
MQITLQWNTPSASLFSLVFFLVLLDVFFVMEQLSVLVEEGMDG